MTRTDAVVIGSGPNGLVAANLLADAGWDVVLLEAQDGVGGAVRSDSGVRDGFVHDTFSLFYPLAAVSPTIQRLGLERHGLAWSHAPPWPARRSPTAAGRCCTAPPRRPPPGWTPWRRPVTATPGWSRGWDAIGDQVVGALLSPFRPSGTAGRAREGPGGGRALVPEAGASPARSVADRYFSGDGAKMLLAGNAAHADISMDAPGSGMMGWILIMMGQQAGFPVPTGGAGMLTAAMARRFEAAGGTVRLGRATEVVVRDGRGRRTHRARRRGRGHPGGGRRRGGARAVRRPGRLAPPPGPPAPPDARVRAGPRHGQGRLGPRRAGPWRHQPDKTPGTVHLGESVDEVALAGAQISAGAVPERPFVLVGQMAAADPTRAPAGAESVVGLQPRLQQVRSDAGGAGIRRVGPRRRRADGRPDAGPDRGVRPGFGDRVLARRLLGPREMQERDENLVGGALNGGTASLQQQLVFRPVPGLGRVETPVPGLYLGSASAHPGGGVHGARGSNAARAALAHDRVRRLRPGSRTTQEGTP